MNSKLLKPLLYFSLLALFVSCAPKSNWGTEINWEKLDINSLPAKVDYPDYGAIILHDEAKIENFGDEDGGWSLYSRHRIVKIFDIRGHQYANMAIPYSPGNEIEDLQARTISPSGKITVVQVDNIYDISLYPNFMLYSDQRSKLFTFPAIENESVVEYKYSVRYQRHNYGNSWTFQDNVPVLYSKYEIQIPSEAKPLYKISGIEIEPQINKAPEGFKSTYTWEATNLEAIEPEIGMPVRKHAVARLSISSNSLKTWDEVGDWYRNLSSPRISASEELKNLTNNITRGHVENYQKLKAIYNWVNENIRYISVSIGIGSYQPHFASEVFENRYGDCKDMTILLCAMAKEVDIDVYPVIISTWQNGEVDTSIVSVGHFNHLIAFCPDLGDSGVWMDATDKACQFDDLPWYDQGRLVLVVSEDNSTFQNTPKLNYLSNRSITNWKVDLKADGSATVEGENRIWGAQANDLRYDFLVQSEKDRFQWMKNRIEERCLFSELDSMSIHGTDPIKDPLTLKYKFTTESFANSINHELIFCPGDISNMNLSDFFTDEERKYPVHFKYGMQQQLNLEINMPNNWILKTPEEDSYFESEFGEASWRWYVNANKIHIQNQFVLKGEDVRPEEYPEFKSFLKKVRKQELKQMIFGKNKN